MGVPLLSAQCCCSPSSPPLTVQHRLRGPPRRDSQSCQEDCLTAGHAKLRCAHSSAAASASVLLLWPLVSLVQAALSLHWRPLHLVRVSAPAPAVVGATISVAHPLCLALVQAPPLAAADQHAPPLQPGPLSRVWLQAQAHSPLPEQQAQEMQAIPQSHPQAVHRHGSPQVAPEHGQHRLEISAASARRRWAVLQVHLHACSPDCSVSRGAQCPGMPAHPRRHLAPRVEHLQRSWPLLLP